MKVRVLALDYDGTIATAGALSVRLARAEPVESFDSLALSLSKGELAQDRPGEPRARRSSFRLRQGSGGPP